MIHATTVACPKCRQGVGDPCRTPGGKTTGAHIERQLEAEYLSPPPVVRGNALADMLMAIAEQPSYTPVRFNQQFDEVFGKGDGK